MTKFRVLSLGILAVLSVTAFGVVSATADTGGHFTSSVHHTTLVGTETALPPHRLHFTEEGKSEEDWIGCDKDHYTGTLTVTTAESITITPNWSECYTTGTPNTKFDIHENGCHFTFTIGDTGTHHTVHLTCPEGKAIEITHQNCNITVKPSTHLGVVYKTDTTSNKKHSITLEVTVKGIASEYHSGLCIFLGTNHVSEMRGSVTVEGRNTAEEPVDITATTTP